jgi:hypothetical protein
MTPRVNLPVLKPEDCAKFQTCNASICPIDPLWPGAVHPEGEMVCFYLRASGKEGAAERFKDAPVFQACLEQLPAVAARHPDIRRRVERAAHSPVQGTHRLGKRPGE